MKRALRSFSASEAGCDLLAGDHGSGLAFAGVPYGDRKTTVVFQRPAL
jgi:hypothetical protein